jgi:hypothetical protein
MAQLTVVTASAEPSVYLHYTRFHASRLSVDLMRGEEYKVHRSRFRTSVRGMYEEASIPLP